MPSSHATRTGGGPTSRDCTRSASHRIESVDTVGARRDARPARQRGARRGTDHRRAGGRRSSRGPTRCSPRGSSSPRSRRRPTVHPGLVQRALADGSRRRVEVRRALERAVAWRRVRVRPPGCRRARPGVDRARGESAPMRRSSPPRSSLLDEGASLTVIDAYASPAGAAALQRRDGDALGRRATRASTTTPCSSGAQGVWHIALQRARPRRQREAALHRASRSARACRRCGGR